MKRAILLALTLAASCTSTPSGPGPGSGSGPGTMTAFVVDLITNQTADTTPSVGYETFGSLPDPDGDANNADAYASLF